MKSSKQSINAPELQHLSLEDRTRLWQWAQERTGFYRRHGCLAVALGILVVVLIAFSLDHLLKQLNMRWLLLVIPTIIGTLAAFVLHQDKHTIQAIRDRLNVQFEGRLRPTCWKCGHVLDGLAETATRCPECGDDDLHGNPTPEARKRDRFGW